jgi:hypothetical protein
MSGRQQIAIAQEAAAGTAEVLALGDAILHTGMAEYDASGVEMTPREAMSAPLSKRGAVPGVRSAKIRWKMYARGSYNHATGANAAVAAGTVSDCDVPLQGCGAARAIAGGGGAEAATYTPSSTTITDESAAAYSTVALYQDGKKYMIHGAVGNCKMTLVVGAPILFEFEFTGVYNAPTDVALLVPVYNANIEPAFLGATLTVLTYATSRLKTLTLDFGNEISLRPHADAAHGLHTAQIVRRNPTGTIDPEEVLVTGKDYWAEWLAGTTGSITTGVIGGTNNNNFNLTIPKAQYNSVGLADRDGVANAPIDFIARANSDLGDDEWSLVQS